MNKFFYKKYLKHFLQYLRNIFFKTGYKISPIDKSHWEDQKDLLSEIQVECILDIGANEGAVSKKYASLFPEARVISFEPIPELANLVKINCPRAEVYELAVYNKEKNNMIFHVNNLIDTSSIYESEDNFLPEDYNSHQDLKSKISVSCCTLDKFTLDKNINTINILKVDIQGAELKVFEGAKRLLEKKQIDLIYTEVFFLPFYKNMPLFNDISSYLTSYGYSFHGFYNESHSGYTGKLQWCDAIFLSPKLNKKSINLLKKSMSRKE